MSKTICGLFQCLWEDNRAPVWEALSHLQAACIQATNAYLNSALLLLQNPSLSEMWREAPGVHYGVAMGKSCLCTGGTATGMCRLAAMTTLERASTCSSLTTRTPCCVTRLCTSTSTTLAEGCWAGAGCVCWLKQAASWCLLSVSKGLKFCVRLPGLVPCLACLTTDPM